MSDTSHDPYLTAFRTRFPQANPGAYAWALVDMMGNGYTEEEAAMTLLGAALVQEDPITAADVLTFRPSTLWAMAVGWEHKAGTKERA